MKPPTQILNNRKDNSGEEFGWFDFNPIERKVIALHTAGFEGEEGIDLVKLLQIKLSYHLWMALISEDTPLSLKRKMIECEYSYRERTLTKISIKPRLLKAALSWMTHFATPQAQDIIVEVNKHDVRDDLGCYGDDVHYEAKL